MNRKLSIIRLLTSQHKGAETENALSSRNNCMDVYYFNNKLKMKKRILTVLTVICVMASGFGAYYSYEPNPNLTSCLFADEIEALSQSGEANPSKKKSAKETWMEQDRKQTAIENAMEAGFSFLEKGANALGQAYDGAKQVAGDMYDYMKYTELNKDLKHLPCATYEKKQERSYSYDTSYGVSVKGSTVVVGFSLSGSGQGGYYEMKSDGKYQLLCQSEYLSTCDRRDQRDCDGKPIVK